MTYNRSMDRRSSLSTAVAIAVTGSVCVGLILLALAWSAFEATNLFLENAWPIRAEVIALEPVGDARAQSHPVIRFTTRHGSEVRMALAGADLSPGSTVNLLYDEDEPENIRINDYRHLWLESLLFCLAGCLLVVIPPTAWAWERFLRR